jgi:hypothetical protein
MGSDGTVVDVGGGRWVSKLAFTRGTSGKVERAMDSRGTQLRNMRQPPRELLLRIRALLMRLVDQSEVVEESDTGEEHLRVVE